MTDLIPAHSPALPAHPDDVVLPGTAERIKKAVPKNTKRAYDAALTQFETWCAEHGRVALPASPATLADYVAHLADLNRAPSTIKQAIAAIRKQHRLAGYPKGTPDSEGALVVLSGHQRERAEEGQREHQAPPITRELLQRMAAASDRTTLRGKRDRLLFVLGWAMASRRVELSKLRIEDIRPDGGGGLNILIRASKTDQSGKGVVVNVPQGNHVDTDPVGLLHVWLSALEESGQDATTGPLFRAITQHGRLYRHGSISGKSITPIVRSALRRAGVPDWHLYSSHSLRAGFATQAAEDNIPMPLWAEQGRWKKTSTVAAGYVRTVSMRRDNPLKRMGL